MCDFTKTPRNVDSENPELSFEVRAISQLKEAQIHRNEGLIQLVKHLDNLISADSRLFSTKYNVNETIADKYLINYLKMKGYKVTKFAKELKTKESNLCELLIEWADV